MTPWRGRGLKLKNILVVKRHGARGSSLGLPGGGRLKLDNKLVVKQHRPGGGKLELDNKIVVKQHRPGGGC